MKVTSAFVKYKNKIAKTLEKMDYKDPDLASEEPSSEMSIKLLHQKAFL